MEFVKKLKILAVIFIVLTISAAGFLAYKIFFPKTPENSAVKSEESQPVKITADALPKYQKPAPSAPAVVPGFKLYKNSEFGFEIQYPQFWTISEENIVNVRGEDTKGFFFKKPNSDLRFAILPRDGLSYGLASNGTSTPVVIGGSLGVQTQYLLKDGRRLWLLHPQYGLYNWSQDIGRIDILSSAADPAGDTLIFEKMLSSFKLKI